MFAVRCRCSCSQSVMRGAQAEVPAPALVRREQQKGAAAQSDRIVRTDSQAQTLDSFLERPPTREGPAFTAAHDAVARKRKAAGPAPHQETAHAVRREAGEACTLADGAAASWPACSSPEADAVAALQADIDTRSDEGAVFHPSVEFASRQLSTAHPSTCTPLEAARWICAGLRQRLRRLVYVGSVQRSRLLVQEDTNLLLLDMGTLSATSSNDWCH